ncbi:HNH endonuclease family protein, partial [Microcoleus sp. Pol17_C1]|uniref:HNH endonuclease family protein n=1 Tax=unclassified Microcoleus TaxID=2642155 RepID=UPI002FD6E16B
HCTFNFRIWLINLYPELLFNVRLPCIRLAQFLITQCFLVVVSTPDFDSAYRIFSVLNNRGLDLSLTDILKADIIGKIPEGQKEKYTKKWEDTEEELGRELFKDLFSHIRMIKEKKKLSKSILKEFQENINPAAGSQQFIDEILDPYAKAFSEIQNLTYESERRAEEINQLFKWLNKIENVDWIPPAILYLSRNRNSPDNLVRFFTDLDRIAAGLMIVRANINERIERYSRLLTAIEQEEDLFNSNSPLQFTPEESNNILRVLDSDLYLIQKIRLYVLLRLDAALSEGEASYNFSKITVEHVLPQNPGANSEWMKWFPSQEERDQYVHRLGNLVLLSGAKNTQAKNYDFDVKKQKYFTTKTGVSPFVLTTQVLREQEWTPEVIARRQKELINVLKNLWRL